MTWLKLPNVGESVVVTIQTIGDVRDDTVRFHTSAGDDLYLPRAVALARLRDCGFLKAGSTVDVDYDAITGAQLLFSKLAPEAGGTRPRWMIERTTSPIQNTHTNGAPTVQVDDVHALTEQGKVRDGKREAIVLAYIDAMQKSLAVQRAVFKGKGPKPTAESVQAGAATLLIQWERNRCL